MNDRLHNAVASIAPPIVASPAKRIQAFTGDPDFMSSLARGLAVVQALGGALLLQRGGQPLRDQTPLFLTVLVGFGGVALSGGATARTFGILDSFSAAPGTPMLARSRSISGFSGSGTGCAAA